MTSLRKFLDQAKASKGESDVVINEPASGSFVCQDQDCQELVFEGYIDRVHSRLHWTCSNEHDSSVVI